METTELIFMAVASLMLTLLVMPAAIRISCMVGAVDEPDARKVHAKAMPRLGGLAMFIGITSASLLFLDGSAMLAGVLTGLFIAVATGLTDDIRHLSPTTKFAGEILAALAFILISGTPLTSLGDLLGFGNIELGFLAIPVTVFAMVGVINALNLSDGLDGLAGGLSVIASVFLAYFAFDCNFGLTLGLSLILFGALLGFLYYNAHPARIFMGDGGSLLLGFLLSAICVLLAGNGGGHMQLVPISMALILGLPIMDTLLVMGRRILQGKSPFSPDKTHLHHRLMELGIPHAGVVPIMYGLMIVYGLLAISLNDLPEYIQLGIGLLFSAMIFGGVEAMLRLGYHISITHVETNEDEKNHAHPLRRLMVIWLGKSVPLMSWMIPLALLAPALFVTPTGTGYLMMTIMIAAVAAALFPWQACSERMCWQHSIIYLLTFALLFILNLLGPEWVHGYLQTVTIIVAIWVVLKLIFKRHNRVFLTSGIELLMIFITWVMPEVLIHNMQLSADMESTLLQTCVESIPFLLAMKILIRRQTRRNYSLVLALSSSFFLIVLHPLIMG